MAAPRYDIVIYGATGFTGRQMALRLAAHPNRGQFSFAVAGRSRDKLERLSSELEDPVDVIVADADDTTSIRAMVDAARIVASTAGPFARYSDSVVDACVSLGRHYVDITGETPWVKGLIDRHHNQALEGGARIVPLCGFDSVPSDIGAWMLVDYFRREHGDATREVKAFFSLRGAGLNGGTLASALAMAEQGEDRAMADPFLLSPPSAQTEQARRANPDQTTAIFDPDIDRWTAPFVMAPVNTRVVRRSAALQAGTDHPYGHDFRYRESLPTGSKAQAIAMSVGIAAASRLMRTRPGRALLRRLGPSPGEGPSREAMDAGKTRCRMLATAENGARAQLEFVASGDAGNRATITFLCECALALALNESELPGPAGGVLTPATAFGPVLVQRLLAAGVTLRITEGH